MLRKITTAAAIAATFMLTSMPAQASSDVVCTMMGDIAYDAAVMRQQGASQQRTANYLSREIGSFFSDAPNLGKVQGRRVMADFFGNAATTILRVVYTPQGKVVKSVAFPGAMAQATYNVCMADYFN